MEITIKLEEKANVGEWFEAMLHKELTVLADYRFADGMLTRDERKALSSAVGAALDAFRSQLETVAPALYTRSPYEDPPAVASEGADHVLEGEFVALTEAVARDGAVKLRLIGPGWGSSGHYSPEVLKKAAGLFTAGTQMYWDHPTEAEETERPEGSLRNLAAVLSGDASYDAKGPKGPGLYAPAKVFEQYRQAVDEMAPHIGVSIRALGKASDGKADGRFGKLISEIAAVRSVDFVTAPGAGGRVVEMFEAARVGRTLTPGPSPAGRGEDDSSDKEVYDVEELEKLVQANEGLASRVTELEAQNAQLREGLLLREARDLVTGTLASMEMPAMTRTRLTEALAMKPVLADGALDREATAAAVSEAAKKELAYLAEVAGVGRVRDMGGLPTSPAALDSTARMTEAFRDLGLSDEAAKVAANGRGR